MGTTRGRHREAMSPHARRRRDRREIGVLVCQGAAILGGVAAFAGLAIWWTDDADEGRAHELAASGVTTTAHDAEIYHAESCKSCSGTDSVRAVVELSSGPERLRLHGVFPDTDGIPEGEWGAAPTGSPYRGTFDVAYLPSDPSVVMAIPDLVDAASGAEVRDDLIVVGVGGAVLVAAGAGFVALRLTETRAPAHRRARPSLTADA
ncbi:hypothetical protein [Luteimicrobium sp. DT211]|uniref:hypothetical protein n=1 Tax=Luteimicrobium sp. DT211 TaxID=3393412 RepID=UPI003CF4B90B